MTTASNSQINSVTNFQDSLPTAVVGTPGSTITLGKILEQSFGSWAPTSFQQYRVSTKSQNLPNGSPGDKETSYWGIGADAVDSYWVDAQGNRIPDGTIIDRNDFDDVQLHIGNSMISQASITVLVSDDLMAVPVYRTYNIWTSQPAVQASNFDSGSIDPSDVVTSTQTYDKIYSDTPNYNNCNWIADNVAASAGATMPYLNFNDVPSDNVAGGFWRVAYRGDSTPTPANNWSTLTQPGDVIRMVWDGKTGHHTTTVTGTIGPDGRLPVFDNVDRAEINGVEVEVVGQHTARYWNDSEANSITIYRLDPNHQYLISDNGVTQRLQGTVYNDLFDVQAEGDIITTGAGRDEINGSSSSLSGASITDWAGNDWISVSDIASVGATVSYNPITGWLTVSGQANGSGFAAKGATVSLTVNLTPNLTNSFFVSEDDSGTGLIVQSGDKAYEETAFAVVEQRDVVDGNVIEDTDGKSINTVAFGTSTLNVVESGTSIVGTYGTLTIYSDGDYFYDASEKVTFPVGAIATDDFRFTLTNDDGDTEVSNLQVSIIGSADGNSAANRFLLTGPGTTARGGDGNDIYTVDSRQDTVIEMANQGIDRVFSTTDYTLARNVENLTLQGMRDIDGTGNALNNTLTGNARDNHLTGLGGRDVLIGNGGADTFVFTKLSDSSVSRGRDTIKDFSQSDGDKIDLHVVEASLKASGNQAFTFIGERGFTHNAGELNFKHTSGGKTLLSGDTDGNGQADFAVILNGQIDLHKGDFIL